MQQLGCARTSCAHVMQKPRLEETKLMSASKIARVIIVYCPREPCVLCSLATLPGSIASSCIRSPCSCAKSIRRGNKDTPETLLGERLFLETRFAQYFAAHSNGDVNRPLAQGDPLVAQVRNPRAAVPYPSPFAGKSINCRSCHFVDEFSTFIAGMNRTYADFLPRTPIPERGDGQTVTTETHETWWMISFLSTLAILLHGDGEFADCRLLWSRARLTGRDFGWLPDEQGKAVHHIAKVIREDDGQDELGQQYGGSYAKLMLGTATDLPDQFRLASDFRIDVTTCDGSANSQRGCPVDRAYLNSLRFEHTAEGIHSGSAYDMFLAKNNLPAQPAPGETDAEYSQRLLQSSGAVAESQICPAL